MNAILLSFAFIGLLLFAEISRQDCIRALADVAGVPALRSASRSGEFNSPYR
jgi:hypothetical protein